MLVFVESGELEECMEQYQEDAKYLAISSDLLEVPGMIDGSWLLPPATALFCYFKTGDKQKYRENYYRFLSSPRICHFLNLEILASDGIDSEVTFLCYSKMESEMLYPKFLRHFIIENLEIPKKYVVKYKDYTGKNKKFDKDTRGKFDKHAAQMLNKFDESTEILG